MFDCLFHYVCYLQTLRCVWIWEICQWHQGCHGYGGRCDQVRHHNHHWWWWHGNLLCEVGHRGQSFPCVYWWWRLLGAPGRLVYPLQCGIKLNRVGIEMYWIYSIIAHYAVMCAHIWVNVVDISRVSCIIIFKILLLC